MRLRLSAPVRSGEERTAQSKISSNIERKKGQTQQEFAIKFDVQRCWFLAEHLVKTIPAKLVGFFRYEVANRWRFDTEEVFALSGDWSKLVSLLSSRHG